MRARAGDRQLMESMLERITQPLDPEIVERRRVQRFAATLRAARAPVSVISRAAPAQPGPQRTAGREYDQERGYGR